jgi:hypothetical protein
VDATQEVGANHATYNARQAAYDLRKLRGKQLVGKLSRTRRDYLPGPAARTISALLTLRDYVIAPIWPASRSAGATHPVLVSRRYPAGP